MALRTMETAIKAGHDRPRAFRLGIMRWRRAHFPGHICPVCGCTVSDKTARIKHEQHCIRLLLLMRWAGVVGEDMVRLAPYQGAGDVAIEHLMQDFS